MIDLSQIDWQSVLQQVLSNLGMPVAFIAGGLISFIANWQSNRHQTALQDRQYARDKLFTAYQEAISSLFNIIECKNLSTFGDTESSVEKEVFINIKKYFLSLSILESLTKNKEIKNIENESRKIILETTTTPWVEIILAYNVQLKELYFQLREIFKADDRFHL